MDRTDATTAGALQISSGDIKNFINSFGNKPLTFQTDQTERIRILGTGEVGIGETSPAVALDVNGEVRASTGVLFGTDTAAANTLDDYEEGTWTPTFFGDTTAGSYNFNPVAWYTKIGNTATVYANLGGITDVTLGSGDLCIGGLPFTNGSNNALGTVALRSFNVADACVNLSSYVPTNDTKIKIRETRDNNTQSDVQVTDRGNDGSALWVQITYKVT